MANQLRSVIFQRALGAQGIDFEHAFALALRVQSEGAAALHRLQQERLERVLRDAAGPNPVYQQFRAQHAAPGRTSADGVSVPGSASGPLADLPAMSKDDLANSAAVVRHRAGLFPPIVKRTSGSSGRPLSLLKQRSGLAMELASTWRSYAWYGVHPGDRQVRVWGRPLNRRKRAFNLIKSVALNSIQVSAFDVTEAQLRQRLELIRRTTPRFIYGYSSALQALAEYALAERIPPPESLRVVVSTAEPLDPAARRSIEAAFGAPCRDEYGCSEVGSIAHECTAGQMHIMADNLIAEVLKDDGTVASVGCGELLVTDLTNRLTPVIRYRVGDYCELTEATHCDCGLPFPVIGNILGRIEDTIVMPDGTRHHPAKICYLVDKIDEPFGCIRQFQVVQQSAAQFELRVVSDVRFPLTEFQARAQAIFSKELDRGVAIQVRPVAVIPREPSGKFRIVVALDGRSPDTQRARIPG